ncbi:group II intron reverse transcriptase domain-containing protein [candidate division KSB1 bacterium]|nr:group II intron reverse transcriptase domain-containing protein [candidate division KSB1 bacterium]
MESITDEVKKYFDIDFLNTIYDEKVRFSLGVGVDRINHEIFTKDKEFHLSIINRKCQDNSYCFSPYRELLKLKGRDKNPRVISIATIRDKIVLSVLKEILHEIFPEYVNRTLPNSYISEIKDFYKTEANGNLEIMQIDIKGFYDNINQKILINTLQERIQVEFILNLIIKAIQNPTPHKQYYKSELKNLKNMKGVPQGLSISNILANIYLGSFDSKVSRKVKFYRRYVDDIMIIDKNLSENNCFIGLKNELQILGLDVNNEKSCTALANNSFKYLGYELRLPIVTVKKTTYERFLNLIAAKITYYIKNRENIINNNGGTSEFFKRAVIFDLNLKISGAIYNNKSYGWVFYFLEVNDLHILYKMDANITSLLKKLVDFKKNVPSELKKLSKAYYEAKYNRSGKYIINFDSYDSTEKKKSFLINLCIISSKKEYPDKFIDNQFEKVKTKKLLELESDVGLIS